MSLWYLYIFGLLIFALNALELRATDALDESVSFFKIEGTMAPLCRTRYVDKQFSLELPPETEGTKVSIYHHPKPFQIMALVTAWEPSTCHLSRCTLWPVELILHEEHFGFDPVRFSAPSYLSPEQHTGFQFQPLQGNTYGIKKTMSLSNFQVSMPLNAHLAVYEGHVDFSGAWPLEMKYCASGAKMRLDFNAP